ncbi:MAG TPA: fused response regulator/phosphatase [Thermoanaerobaculia bacterium]|nr:fused response regulator/phosphatase [Thermoanaerobaculia bacterium]
MKSERIVVIDDNPNDAQLIRRVLENAGYEVDCASSGEEGLRIIPDVSPNCVLVDYRMPGLDGYEVCRRIKNDPALQTIPVLMLTGADSSRNLIEGLDAGADDFVTKSSDIEVILARVRALLRVKAYQDRIVEQAAQLRQLYEELSHKSDKIMELNQRLNSDLQIARRVQEALLPERNFSTPHAEIRSSYIPTETLSGDFYDYFTQRDSLYMFVADVSGHGLPAAILVSLLKTFLHSEAVDSPSLAAFMARLNDYLVSASLPAQYATAQILRLDPSGKNITFSNGAHPPFLHYEASKGKATATERPGHLVGARPGLGFEEHQVEVAPGDLMFLYTDGLTDRRTVDGEFYGIDRIAAILEREEGKDLSKVYDAVYDDVTSFSATDEFRDDIAFILVRFV